MSENVAEEDLQKEICKVRMQTTDILHNDGNSIDALCAQRGDCSVVEESVEFGR